MLDRLNPLTKAVLYFVIALGLVIGVSALSATASALSEGLGLIYMLMPLTAVLLMLLVITRDGYRAAGWKALGLRRLGVRS